MHFLPTGLLKKLKNLQNAAGRGIKVIIAAAGMAAHLPGVIAAMTPLPVVEFINASLNGLDSIFPFFRCLLVYPLQL